MIWVIIGGFALFMTALTWALMIAASDADRQSEAYARRIRHGE